MASFRERLCRKKIRWRSDRGRHWTADINLQPPVTLTGDCTYASSHTLGRRSENFKHTEMWRLNSPAWWHKSAVPFLGRLKQDGSELDAGLNYRVKPWMKNLKRKIKKNWGRRNCEDVWSQARRDEFNPWYPHGRGKNRFLGVVPWPLHKCCSMCAQM